MQIGDVPRRLHKADDFEVKVTFGGNVSITVDGDTFVIEASRARQVSMEIATCLALSEPRSGLTIHLDGNRFHLAGQQAIKYTFKVFCAAQEALAKRGLQH